MTAAFELANPVVFGAGTSLQAAEYATKFNATSILVIISRSVKASGAVDQMLAKLEAEFTSVTYFDQVTADPDEELVEEITRVARSVNTDLIIAVGGGSPIDVAKAVRLVLCHGGEISDYEGVDKVASVEMPLIAIPTTSGTGSEITSFSIVSNHHAKRKMVIVGAAVAADVALVDPLLTLALPASVTAATGMDALTHAVEAYLSTISTALTDVHALKAIQCIADYLPTAVSQPDNVEARTQVMLGSLLAGMAFNCAILGLAHAIANPLGAMFTIPHGVANAGVLASVVRFNAQAVPEKVLQIGQAMGLKNATVDDVVTAIADLSKELNIPPLEAFGITSESYDDIATAALGEAAIMTNPREVTFEGVQQVLKNCA